MISRQKMLTLCRYLTVCLVFSFIGCSTSRASDALCGIEFDAKKFGFTVQPINPDEASGCGRFLLSERKYISEQVIVSLIALTGSAPQILKTIPSNFVVTKNGSLEFKLPRRVSDPRFFYFVRPLRILSERKISMPDGTIYFAEHKRKVDRLKKINDREEQEVTELQLCVDAVRTTVNNTVLLSGCDLAKNGSFLSVRMLGLLKAAALPLTAPIEQPKK